MKLATWNNDLNRRLPIVLDWLAEAKPDVVALQETRCVDADFPHAALEAATPPFSSSPPAILIVVRPDFLSVAPQH